MRAKLVTKTLGAFFVLLGVVICIPLCVSLLYGERDLIPFLVAVCLSVGIGSLAYFGCRNATGQLRNRDALLLVSLVWFSVTAIGAVPYYLYEGAFATLVDSWFESASGFTTTGATVLSDIEALPHGLLLWRSLTQFLGGMGIIVLSVAVLPLLGIGGMELYRAEVPGPTSDKISARVSETARILWVVYVLFAFIEFIVLCVLGMPVFDSINHALTTMATGGFSTKNASVAGFNSASIDWAITFFMLCAGINFLLHYRLFVRRDFSIFKDKEFLFYLSMIGMSALLLVVVLWGEHYGSFEDSLRFSVFQVISIVTTTGYATADFLVWGAFAQCLLIVLMVIGGSAGSTAGGAKCVRAMMLIKQGYRELYMTIHRSAVYPLKLGGHPVPSGVASAIFGYFFLYILLLVVTALFVTASGVDVVTAFSSTISALSNVGPGLGDVGPVLNYGSMPELAKVLLGMCMIIGRLEIFTVLVLFTSEFWSA